MADPSRQAPRNRQPHSRRRRRVYGDCKPTAADYAGLAYTRGGTVHLGRAMSQVENTLAPSMLLRRFQPEYVGVEPPGVTATVTLTPRGGLHFKMHER